MSLSLKYGDPPLFCALCGSELIPKEVKIGSQFIWIYMRCPKKKTPSWWMQLFENKCRSHPADPPEGCNYTPEKTWENNNFLPGQRRELPVV